MKEIPSVYGYIVLLIWFAAMAAGLLIITVYMIKSRENDCIDKEQNESNVLSDQERVNIQVVLEGYRQSMSRAEYITLIQRVTKLQGMDLILEKILYQIKTEMDAESIEELNKDNVY